MTGNESMDAPVTSSVFNAFRAEVLERFEADRKEREAEREADRKEREAEMQEIKKNFAMIFERLDSDKKDREAAKMRRDDEVAKMWSDWKAGNYSAFLWNGIMLHKGELRFVFFCLCFRFGLIDL